MIYDLRGNLDDASYERLIDGILVSDLVVDLDEGLKELHNDFYNGKCARGIIYDYDTGTAISMAPIEVGKDWVNVTYDDYNTYSRVRGL